MPAWMKEIEHGMERGGVDNPYALMNAMGIKRGSETIVDEDEAKAKMAAYGRRVGRHRRRGASARDAAESMVRD